MPSRLLAPGANRYDIIEILLDNAVSFCGFHLNFIRITCSICYFRFFGIVLASKGSN